MLEILVIKPSSFGDIVHGLQVLESFKQRSPEARVTWVVRDIFAPIVQACDTVDEVLVFNRKGSIGDFLGLLQNIRKKTYDIVVDLQGLARSGLMTFSARAHEKIGRKDAREGAGLAYSSIIPLPQKERPHALEILLELLPVLGYPADLEGILTFSKAEPSSQIAGLLPLPKKTILMFPDSRRKEKEWPGFFELTDKLLGEGDPDISIIWAGSDSSFTADPTWSKERFLNLMGKTEITDIIPLILGAELVVTNDSGPMHLAAAMNARVMAIFGPTDPQKYGPYPLNSTRNKVICGEDGDINRVKVSDVYGVVLEWVKENQLRG